jgi:hypothetical protein
MYGMGGYGSYSGMGGYGSTGSYMGSGGYGSSYGGYGGTMGGYGSSNLRSSKNKFIKPALLPKAIKLNLTQTAKLSQMTPTIHNAKRCRRSVNVLHE